MTVGGMLRLLTKTSNIFRDQWRRTPLIAMVEQFKMEKKQDYLDVFYWLMNDTHCDVNKRDSWRNTALHNVLERTFFKIGEEKMRKDEKIVRNEMAMALINHPDISDELTLMEILLFIEKIYRNIKLLIQIW